MHKHMINMKLLTGLPGNTLVLLIRLYKIVLSPFLGRNCRFEPGCANYMIEAVQKHGAVRGFWLGARRIGRCHPWHEGGYDPVPESH